MSSQSSIYVSSISEREDYTSVSDAQISQLQAEILQQSKGIEKYIRNSSKVEDSTSFSVLKSLFALFKSELSVNLKLRTILVDERNKCSQINDEIKYFFHSLHKLGFTNINDFQSVLDLISNQDKYYQDFQKSARKTIKSEKHKNKKLQSQILSLQRLSSLNDESNDEKQKELSVLSEKISQIEQNTQQLNKTIQDKEEMINSLKREIEMKNKENEKSKEIISNLEKEIQTIKSTKEIQTAKNNENANKYMLNQIHSLQKENEILKKNQKEYQNQKEREIMDLNAQNIIDIEMIKTECNQKCNAVKTEKENVESQLRTEIEDMKKINNQLKLQVADLYQSNEKIQIQITETENNNKNLNNVNSTLYQKLKKMKSKFKNVKKAFYEENKNHQFEIEQIKGDYDSQLKSSISQVEAEVKEKLEQTESVNKQLRITIDEQKSEVNSLRDLIKKLSFNLQQEEAENAKMQASLQMNKYNSFWNPAINQKKEQKIKKNSCRTDYSYSQIASDSSAV